MRIPLGLRAAAGAAGAAPAGGWDLDGLSYTPDSTFTALALNHQSLSMKTDGTKMYLGVSSTVYEYDLSTAWDLSTASLNQTASTTETTLTGLSFKPDGTKMYCCGNATGDNIEEYDLSTAWDISTLSFAGNFSTTTQQTLPQGIYFKGDGSTVYLIGGSPDAVSQYSLSTAWDITSASHAQNFSVASESTDPRGIYFKSDGTLMFVVDDSGNDVNQYGLSTAWDISTASYEKSTTSSIGTNPRDIYFKSDGSLMLIIDDGANVISAYPIS